MLARYFYFKMCVNLHRDVDSRMGVCNVTHMSSREVIKLLGKAGWFRVRVTGDHYQFKHPEIKGLVTVPHPRKDLTLKTIISIEKQSGLTLRRR